MEYANAEEKDLDPVITWIAAAQLGDVVRFLREMREKRAALAEKPTANQGSGAAAKGKKAKEPPCEASKAPPEAEGQAAKSCSSYYLI